MQIFLARIFAFRATTFLAFGKRFPKRPLIDSHQKESEGRHQIIPLFFGTSVHAAMLFSSESDTHLEAIDQTAEQMFDQLIRQYAAAEGVTEELKAADPQEWVQQMNGIRSRATEIVNAELIYQ